MRTITFNLVIFVSSFSLYGQDIINKLNGEKLIVIISKVSDGNVEFTLPGESVVQVMSKKLIQNIVYKSGREEKVNDKVRIFSEGDYELVSVTLEIKEVEGLRKIGDIVAKHSIPYGGRAKLKEKALVKLKKEAARIGAHMILLQSDEFSNSPINAVSLSGIAYGY